MTNNSNILILGATAFVIPLIRTAQKNNLKTIVCSNVNTDPGLKIADYPKNVSILDRLGLQKIFEEYNPIGVVTAASDLTTISLGYLNDHYNLAGLREHQVLSVSNKGEFINLQKKLGLPSPNSMCVYNKTDLAKACSSIKFPAIMKPFFSSGSRGVKVVKNKSEAYKNHQLCYETSSLTKGYVIQEYLSDYKEIGCEVFVEKGKVVFLKTTYKYKNSFNVPLGHCVPGSSSEKELKELTRQVEKICSFLKISDTPVNIDILTKQGEQPTIIDISFRLGGNLLPDIMDEAYANNPYQVVIDYALGMKLNHHFKDIGKGIVGSVIFGSEITQEFTLDLKEKVENVFKKYAISMRWYKEVGETLSPFIQGNQSFGGVLVRCPSKVIYEKLLSESQRIINHT